MFPPRFKYNPMTTNVAAANLYNQLFTCQNDNSRHGELKYPVVYFQDLEMELSTVRKGGQITSPGSMGRIRKLGLINWPDILPLGVLNGGRDIKGPGSRMKNKYPRNVALGRKKNLLVLVWQQYI